MRRMKVTVVEESNGALSLWIEDESLGQGIRHRGGLRLAENHDHAAFYQAVAPAKEKYASKGVQVNYIDRVNQEKYDGKNF